MTSGAYVTHGAYGLMEHLELISLFVSFYPVFIYINEY